MAALAGLRDSVRAAWSRRAIARLTPTGATLRYVRELERIFRRCEDVPGDVVELGTFSGTNAVIFTRLIQQSGAPRRYLGFDTFRGYPPEDIDGSPNAEGLRRNMAAGKWVHSKRELERLLARIGCAGLAEIVEGDLKRTLPERIARGGLHAVALLYVDCNAYAPAYAGMQACRPLLRPGSVVCIDEHQVGGETAALERFAAEQGLEIQRTGNRYPDGPPMFVVAG